MNYISANLIRLGSTPTADAERVGATPTAEGDYLGGLPLATLVGVGKMPTAMLEHLGGITVDGGLFLNIGRDTLAISESSLSFDNIIGVEKTFSVMATSYWTAELIDDFGLFSISTTSGVGGLVGELTITLVAENTVGDEYSASIIVRCGGLRKELMLTVAAGVATYTPLTYIECTGQQYIDLGYVVKDDDVIKCYYDCNVLTKEDKFLFGTYDSNAVWLSIYNYKAYTRFGSGTTTSTTNASRNHYVEVRKELATFDGTATALPYEEMPATPLFLFARRSTSGVAGAHFVGRCTMFKISNANGDVIELRPVKRARDGKIGMLDIVSGTFYASEGDADFIGGNEVRITEDYEIIDRVSFNKDKAFNTGYYGNNTTSIDVMFQRTNTSSAAYLFGLTQGNRLTGYLAASSAYWRYGSAAPTFSLGTTKIYKGVVTPGVTTLDDTSKTFEVNEFETSDPIPVGGYKSGSNAVTKHYIGYIYYFRMWHGDTLLVDWCPCKRLSDGVEGFWDCVSQTFKEPM